MAACERKERGGCRGRRGLPALLTRTKAGATRSRVKRGGDEDGSAERTTNEDDEGFVEGDEGEMTNKATGIGIRSRAMGRRARGARAGTTIRVREGTRGGRRSLQLQRAMTSRRAAATRGTRTRTTVRDDEGARGGRRSGKTRDKGRAAIWDDEGTRGSGDPRVERQRRA